MNCQNIPEAEKYEFHFLDAPLELSGFSQDFDIIKYLEKCRQYIKQHDIKVVLATRDIPSLLQAQLSQEFAHLRDPSLESYFLCLHLLFICLICFVFVRVFMCLLFLFLFDVFLICSICFL